MSLTLEYAAVALGLAYLVLAIRERRGCWIAGGAASAMFLVVFWNTGLFMQAALQLYYVGIAVHGWFYWGKDGADGAAPVVRHRLRRHLFYAGAWILLASLSLAVLPGASTAESTLDAISSWGGVLATWMVARKELEAWLYWIVIDLLTAVLYLRSDLLPSFALYLVYTGLAALAFIEWRKHYLQQNSPTVNAAA